MRDMILAVVTLLVLALGASVLLLLRRVGQIATQMREAEQRRKAEQVHAVAEVRRILGEDDQPGNGDRRRRRHLRVLPVFAGLLAVPAVVARWSLANPLQAAAAAAMTTAAAVAVMATPGSRPDNALPEPAPPGVELPDLNKPPRHPAPPEPAMQRGRPARPKLSRTPEPTPSPPGEIVAPPGDDGPAGPPTTEPPTVELPEPPPDALLTARVDVLNLLDLRVELPPLTAPLRLAVGVA